MIPLFGKNGEVPAKLTVAFAEGSLWKDSGVAGCLDAYFGKHHPNREIRFVKLDELEAEPIDWVLLSLHSTAELLNRSIESVRSAGAKAIVVVESDSVLIRESAELDADFVVRLDEMPAGMPQMKLDWLVARRLIQSLFNIKLERELQLDDGIKVGDWNGYKRSEFMLEGREGFIVAPKDYAPGKPWLWRAEFFDAFATVDRALLSQGWAIAYYRISDLYGCPGAVDLMEKFHRFVNETFGVADKTVLFGFSRGGLYAMNYAIAHPEHIRSVYLDAPVLDISSWPGGKGKGVGADWEWKTEWEQCKAVYGMTDKETAYEGVSPLDRLEPLAQAGVPIIVVAGDADIPVPMSENASVLEEMYRNLGGEIEMIVKPGVGHHPHSLEDPKPVVDFILAH